MGRRTGVEWRRAWSDIVLLARGGRFVRDVFAAFALLFWVTVKPFVRPSPAWLPKPA